MEWVLRGLPGGSRCKFLWSGYSGGYLVEAEVSFYGVGSEEELSVTVQDHEEAVQSLQK